MSVADLLKSVKERGIELWFEGERLRFRAPKDALTAEQRAELSARRAEIIAQLRADAVGQEKTYPLSFSQRSVWFVHQQAPESWAYHVAMAVRIVSDVDIAAMRQALQALVDRHAVLRTTYDFVEGALFQHVVGRSTAAFVVHVVPGLADDDLRVMVEGDYRRPFDLTRGPVFRASLYTRGRADHVLLLTVHHIAVDGWAAVLLIEELFKLYIEATGGAPADLPRSELQYTDYASWQERTLSGPEGDRLWSYWREKLASPRERLDLPTDHPRPAVQTFRGASVPFQFDLGLTERVKDLARQERTTLFVVLLASFQVFLFRHTGVKDVIVGTPIFARSKDEFMRVVGDFVNSVPLRGRLSAAMTFRDLVGQLRQTVIEALDAQEFPLPLLIQRLQPEREPGRLPLFDTFFQLQRFEQFRHIEALLVGDGSDDAIEFGSLRLGAYPLYQQQGQFDLALQLVERGAVFFGLFTYCTDLFEETTIRGFVADYLALVEALTGKPGTALGDLLMPVTSSDNDISALIDQLRRRDIQVFLEGERLRVNAPKGALDDGLKATIAARRHEIIAALRSATVSTEGRNTGKIRRISRHGLLPVSSAQQRLWFLEQMEPGRSDYNIGSAVRFRGLLDIEIIKQAINELVVRHESFRMCIVDRDGNPGVELLETSEAAVEIVDLLQTSAEMREDVARRLAGALLRKPFDIAHGPLARFLIVRLTSDDHMLVLGMHHVASDGWSWAIALREICEFYDARVTGRPANLPPLSIQYVDYAAWEREQMSSGRMAGHLAYWKQQLQGAPMLLELPTDRPRPASQSFRGGCVRRYFDGRLIDSLKACSKDHDATLFMVLLAAWQVLLHRYSGQDDIVVGSPVANRDLLVLEGLIGCLVNNVVLRVGLGGNPRFADFLGQVKQTMLSAFDHGELPFDVLVEGLNPPRSAGHSAIFQVLFAFSSFPLEVTTPAGLTLEMVNLDWHASRFDLSLDLHIVEIGEHKGELCALYEYATDLFDERTIVRLHAHFEHVLVAVAADPSFRIQEVPLLMPEEERRLLDGWNATALEHDSTRCLHTLLEAAAQTTPEAPAVTAGSVTLSYRELDRRANQLAHLLAARGVHAGDLVAICLDRTVDMPVALAAVLKAGAAYVPLDPTHPAERLHYTLEDAGVSCTITLSRFAPPLDNTKAQLLLLDDVQAALATQPDTTLGVVVRPDDLAYVIYTSGSTGRPKGVQVEHRNVVSFLEAMRCEPSMVATDVLLAVTTLSFDIAGFEIWLPLSIGARVVIASRADGLDGERLITLIEAHRVTILQATPATWRIMLEAGWIGKRNLRALCGGEEMRRELAVALIGKVAELWNMYGPTETTIWSTVFRVLEPSNGIPIGHAIANTRTYVLDSTGRSAPLGMTGELCIAGEGVARGYRNRPELTAEKFAVITLPDGRAERVYRTGDVARFRRDGQLEFFGRRDHQVKVRGYRIELGEIEAILATYAGVKECVVIAREDSPDDHRLIGYVTLSEGASFDPEGARTALRVELPEYMIPNLFMVLPALPLTPNGKLDRNALPVPHAPALRMDHQAEALMTPAQRRVAGIWRGLLRLERVGLHDNFFDLGGHSFLLVKLHARLKREFGGDLALVELFQKTTVAAQADRLSSVVSSNNALERARARTLRQTHG